MTRWKLTIEYDGSTFHGWQRQANQITVQQTLEEALFKFSGESPTLFVAGRTDTGVHARAQVAHVDLSKETNAGTLRDAVNFYVRPHRVSILNAEETDESFHARLNATRRAYRYTIVNRRAPLTFQADYALHVAKPLDIGAMKEAAAIPIGKHDFSTFRARNCQASSPIRTLDKLDVSREGEVVYVDTEARSFLYHQVRNMVGSLVFVGTGQWSIDNFRRAFDACDRTKGGPTAPPQGLCFWNVTYPQK